MTKNRDILKRVLSEIAVGLNFVNYDLEIEFVSSNGANYTSILYNVVISEESRTIYLFAKVAAIGEKMRLYAPKMYEIENFAYTNILIAFDRLQDEHNVIGEDRLIFTKFYGYNPKLFEEVIVLENLVMEGYEAFDRFKSIQWDYAKAAVRQLAKMHALGFAYNTYYEDEFYSVMDSLKLKWKTETEEFYYEGVRRKTIESTMDENKDKIQRFLDTHKGEMYRNMYNQWGRRPVLGHGDFRPSNLLHRRRDDGTVDIKIVDLQTMQGSSPVVDLLYFIFTGSDEQFRAQYYERLVDHYYTQLQAAMKRLHLDPDKTYPRSDFDHELKEKLPFGLTIAVFTLPVVTVETENAPEVNEDMDLSAFSVEKTSALYTERLNGVVNDYVRWGVLK